MPLKKRIRLKKKYKGTKKTEGEKGKKKGGGKTSKVLNDAVASCTHTSHA
jgi:hypothetical protein